MKQIMIYDEEINNILDVPLYPVMRTIKDIPLNHDYHHPASNVSSIVVDK